MRGNTISRENELNNKNMWCTGRERMGWQRRSVVVVMAGRGAAHQCLRAHFERGVAFGKEKNGARTNTYEAKIWAPSSNPSFECKVLPCARCPIHSRAHAMCNVMNIIFLYDSYEAHFSSQRLKFCRMVLLLSDIRRLHVFQSFNKRSMLCTARI